MTNRKSRILIVDDEESVRDLLYQILCADHDCQAVGSAEEAVSFLENESFDLVISDINMGGMSGLELIPQVAVLSPNTVMMMISGNQTIDSAIEAIRGGAFDYIKKPFDIDHVAIAVDRALRHYSLLEEKNRYENHLEELVKQRTEELNYLSYYDVLTDLPNRTLFEDRLSQALVLLPEDWHAAVFFVSLDGFKKVRDTLGHDLGNKVLQEAAKRLLAAVPEGSTVSRFEGDEFAILLQTENTEKIAEIANFIINSIRIPIPAGNNEAFITTSMGITLFPDDDSDIAKLLKNAGVALLRAQEGGGDRYNFYAAGMNASAFRRLAFENNLRGALERGEFEVFYQPKLDVNSRKITGMEALVRWRSPEMGLVPPVEFIPLAEENRMIIPLGEWILKTACAQCKAWRDEGFDLNLSVNLSTRQFQHPDLAQSIIAVLNETGLEASRLDLEMTESAIMKKADLAVETLNQIKAAGVKISIDDFGTGYSSLGYLKSLPLDILKIDKSFIEDLTTDPDAVTLVTAIIGLAHNLRLKVVAEGVEMEEQLKFLQLLKCDEWQGYLFSKPVPADEFRKLLDTI